MVILFFHANAEDLGMSFFMLKHMRDQFKVNIMAVEYPGYGLLQHLEPSEDAVYEVALTTFRFLVDEIHVRYSQLILFGRSLGSGPAVFLAAQYPVGGLILVSAFVSIKAAVQSIAGSAVAWAFSERFANYKLISNVSCSTLIIHGEDDSLIPPEHSLQLFQRCRARKLLVTPPTMEHNSNLFENASFLAIPAIHFFGFPGYYTQTPPRLPAHLFEDPDRQTRISKDAAVVLAMSQAKACWLCDCLAKSEVQNESFLKQSHGFESPRQCGDMHGVSVTMAAFSDDWAGNQTHKPGESELQCKDEVGSPLPFPEKYRFTKLTPRGQERDVMCLPGDQFEV